MKKNSAFCLLLIAFILSHFQSVCAAAKIGKVDLGLVVSIHPEMALFDFSRMGFFKVPPGLSADDFAIAVQQLKDRPISTDLQDQRQKLESDIRIIDREKSVLMEKLAGLSAEEGEKVSIDLNNLARKQEQLFGKISDLEYQQNCPDLTSPEETRARLAAIEKQVISELEKMAAEKGYEIVFNSSITVPFNYPKRYRSGSQYGIGVPGLDYSLFYSFLANRDHVLPSDDTPESRRLINWLELINFPEALNLLPLKPYPLVLQGGEDISAGLIERIYRIHRVEEKVITTVLSITSIIKKHEEKFDTDIESIVGPR
ncbi:MAG: hypothetical protein ACOYXC_07155 [Candidatus Rifleibacteriota bacterium]